MFDLNQHYSDFWYRFMDEYLDIITHVNIVETAETTPLVFGKSTKHAYWWKNITKVGKMSEYCMFQELRCMMTFQAFVAEKNKEAPVKGQRGSILKKDLVARDGLVSSLTEPTAQLGKRLLFVAAQWSATTWCTNSLFFSHHVLSCH